MYFIPLSQIESVDLVIHALRTAGGEADCTTCPARRVCMKQCLTIAEAVTSMVAAGSLPMISGDPEPPPPGEPEKGENKKGHLKVLK